MTAQYTGIWYHDAAMSDDDSWFDDDSLFDDEQDWDTIRKDESLIRQYDE